MTRVTTLLLVTTVTCACDSPSQRAQSLVTGPSPVSSPTPPPAPGGMPPGQSNAERYVLTLTIGDSCAAVPDRDRTRTYSATFETRSQGDMLVTLGDARFLSGLICTAASGRFNGVGCNQFFASEDIDTVTFFLDNNNDEAHGGHIVEQLPSGGWWEVIGTATGRRTGSSIEAVGKASVWYCPLPLGYPFPCNAFQSCRDVDLRLTVSPTIATASSETQRRGGSYTH